VPCLVTHDVQKALVLADRVLVIEDGKIACDLRLDLTRPRQHGLCGPRAQIAGDCARRLYR